MKKNQNQKQKNEKQAELISQLETVKVVPVDRFNLLTGTIRKKLESLVSDDTNDSEKIKIIYEVNGILKPLLHKYKTGKFQDGIFMFSEDIEKAGQFINKLSCDKQVLAFIKLALENHDDPNIQIPNLDNIMDKINIDEIPLLEESHQEEVDIISASYNIFRNILYGIPEDDKDFIALKASGL